MSLYQIRVNPNPVTSIFIRIGKFRHRHARGGNGHEKTQVEAQGMPPQAKDAKDHWLPPEASRNREFSPKAFE